MTRLALLLATLWLLAVASAQERHNYLAVNGTVVDAAGPYYFIAQGDRANAYARALPLAEAMGVDVDYLADDHVLVWSDGRRTVRIPATSDVEDGLVKRDGVIGIDPPLAGVASLASPKAILVEGTAYVPVGPLVAAFGGASDWSSESRVVTVTTADRLGYELAGPRTGLTDGVSRVALDVPAEASYDVAVGTNTLVVGFVGARTDGARLDVDDPNVASVTLTSSGGRVSLTVRTKHALDAAGEGFRVGTLDRGASRTLYIDFAPSLRGPAVAALDDATSAPQALAAAPEVRQVVVIDAGHGGHDPGTTSRYAIEEQVVLSVALRLQDLLEAEGLEVILTRDHDTFLTLQERSAFATPERNIFVSIHANAAPSNEAAGIETWVFGKPLDPSLVDRAIRENGGGAEGQALTEAARRTAESLAADILQEAQLNLSLSLAESVQESLVGATGARDRGVRANLFYVIRTARIPAILVELGFVSNPEEGGKLATEAYQRTLAEGLADGILAFLRGGGVLARR